MHKREMLKGDGRRLTLYGLKSIPENIEPVSPKGVEVSGSPHLRWHPWREEWVAYASHRQNRTFLPPKEFNPLAPTKSPEFPTELPAGDYDIAVFDNLFASLQAQASGAPELYVPTRPGDGECEVVVFTQDPDTSLGRLPLERVRLLIDVWADRYQAIARNKNIRYILPFENRGQEVGVTLHHPHGQIYSYPFLPPLIEKMNQAQKSFFAKNGKTLFGDLLHSELRENKRVICSSGGVHAILPACARYPYETWIVPERPVAQLFDFSPAERDDLARVLKTLLLNFDGLWKKPFPYLMALYAAPAGVSEGWHFHIEFYPPYRSQDRLKYLAGTELAAGMFVNDSLPEEKAAELRAVEVKLD
jgi:UDPglucose--hexose-1-phosphate uridylyltransferase